MVGSIITLFRLTDWRTDRRAWIHRTQQGGSKKRDPNWPFFTGFLAKVSKIMALHLKKSKNCKSMLVLLLHTNSHKCSCACACASEFFQMQGHFFWRFGKKTPWKMANLGPVFCMSIRKHPLPIIQQCNTFGNFHKASFEKRPMQDIRPYSWVGHVLPLDLHDTSFTPVVV